MNKVRSLTAILALSALAALPGCAHHEAMAPAEAQAAPAPPPPPVASNPQQNAMSRSLVRQVQIELKHGHMYAGHVDGIWGPLTRHGVMRFQHKNNLQASGELDDATLQAMGLTASGGGMSDTGSGGTNMPAAGMDNGAPPAGGAMNAPGEVPGAGTGGTAAPAR